ncbi:MAG TPA: polysaccharide deacetylase family protein [Candidatus Acidoferrum sp.]|jgi:peptidoglycan/xylan/chitin deacetylase (PgdA/CDA1 family)|nr:polysaccharide deacetylase family protein [Candidatus Acidoferrum sp.]
MIPLLATLVVLMYHRVAPDVPTNPVGAQLTLAPATFAAELDLLAREHVRTYTTDEAAQLLAHGERPSGVVLSFDDGRADGYEVVLPILERHGMHASFYVNSSTIDAPLHMTWANLRALRAAGDEIGCHGHEHVDLGVLPEDAQRYQIVHCLDLVQRHVGSRPRTYAYASGRYDETTRQLILRNDLDAALTEHPGDVGPGVDPTQWPRRRINRDTTLAAFRSLIAGALHEREGNLRLPQNVRATFALSCSRRTRCALSDSSPPH